MSRVPKSPWAVSLLALAGCGGKSGAPAIPCSSPVMASLGDPNTAALIVDQGPPDATNPYFNGAFVAVTICVPGTGTCQTIDHVLVDTGSMGLRLLESLVTLPLPAATTDQGIALAECLPFLDGSSWGPLRHADVKVDGEIASNIPIQLIGEMTYPVPSTCTGIPANDLNSLGSNGILGVGPLAEDCGANCATTTQSRLYYACDTTCRPTLVPVAEQVPNPVAALPVDNNGVIIQLPCVPEKGAPSVSGVMVFGIGTQTNNGLGSATVLRTNVSGIATLGTEFPEGGTSYTGFFDSGTNVLFFLDAATSGLKQCPSTGKHDYSGFYCPSSTTNLTAAIFDDRSAIAPVAFRVANLFSLSSTAYALDDIAGPMPGWHSTAPADFDWGLPFHFGRSVYTAIEGKPTPVGPGPYFAF